jgi:hypothetical protein
VGIGGKAVDTKKDRDRKYSRGLSEWTTLRPRLGAQTKRVQSENVPFEPEPLINRWMFAQVRLAAVVALLEPLNTRRV